MARKNYKKKNSSKKNNRKKSSAVVSKINKLEKLVKNNVPRPEFKYQYAGVYNYSGDIADAVASFYKDKTGMIKTMDPLIAQGDGHNQRIGNSIKLRRIALQFVARWPLLSYTPNWNSINQGAVTNVNLTTKDVRLDLPCKIHLVRFEHADGSYADFSKYMAGFKRMYTLGEDMDNQARSIRRQEVKVLATKSFTLRRRLEFTQNGATTLYNYTNIPYEGMINVSCNQRLDFKKDQSNNLAQNYRYAWVLQFGHLADQFLTIDEKYNPIISAKAHYWYTDM